MFSAKRFEDHRQPEEPAPSLGRRELLGAIALSCLVGCTGRRHDPKSLVIGSSPTGVPFSFVDPWTNELTGAMVDVARLVARGIGRSADFRITPFSALIPSLLSDKIDMVAAAIVKTPERAAVVSFSDPIFDYSGALVVRNDIAGNFPDLRSLGRLTVGAQVGTRYVDQLRAAGVSPVVTYDSLTDILRDMQFGRIGAGFGDGPLLAYQLRVGPKRPVRLVKEFTPPVHEQLCMLTRKDSAILPNVNRVIEQLRQRDIGGITKKWGIG